MLNLINMYVQAYSYDASYPYAYVFLIRIFDIHTKPSGASHCVLPVKALL